MKRGSKAYSYSLRAKEAMLAAVEVFNSPLITFKSELCITMIATAWTYLFQAYCLANRIEFRKPLKHGKRIQYEKTAEGEYKTLSLGELIDKCPDFLNPAEKCNLRFLIEFRNRIQHSADYSIDGIVAPKIQANVLNFKRRILDVTDGQIDIDQLLPLALQFSEMSFEQIENLLTSKHVSQPLRTFIIDFERGLSEEERSDTAYEARVKFDLENKNRGEGLYTLATVPIGSEAPSNATIIAKKEVEKKKYRPSDVVKLMKDEGYTDFTIHKHTELWQTRNARRPGPGYGVEVAGAWYWYDKWINEVVRPHCIATFNNNRNPADG